MAPEKTRTVRCVGFNYALHAIQTNITIPDFPVLFFKPWTALAPPNGQVPVTEGYQTQGNFTSEMDYESELVVVINKAAYNISVDDALDHVLGYAAGYDVSHRGWQIARGGEPQPQFSMGKDADGWAPWGPAISTKDVIPNPQNLSIWAKVNGVTKQNDTTANMLFGVAELVSFFSMGMTLMPGDIIYTGTPAGVQLGMADPVWLVDGDVVEVGLDGLGTCTSTITYSNASISSFDPILGFTGVIHG
jgi:2-keto-4-pentenoate hydratase/2-oxohepta-3-ene-1,7-dioic acid hydratase in catechol pathway